MPEEAERILRRMSASCGDALSAISSSDSIELVISSSKYLFGTSCAKYCDMLMSSSSAAFCDHSATDLTARSRDAIPSSSPMLSTPPDAAFLS